MKRRTFLAGVGGTVGAIAGATDIVSTGIAPIARRPLGKTGRTLPIVGYPCLALKNGDQKTATEQLRRALDIGVDYFDVAPSYGKDGECEIKTGEGLKGVPREKYFIACKTKEDDAKEGRIELERSLKRLNTDHFDLYQLHCLQREDEVKQALGPGGVLEMILKAKEEGKVRHIGFSAHTSEAALAAMDGFDFDSCMFPINFVEWFKTGFGREVADRALEKGVSLISIKPVSRGLWPEGVNKTYNWWYRPLEEENEYQLAMDWVLSLPGMVSTLPTSYFDVFDKTVAAARQYRPIRPADLDSLKTIAQSCTPIFKPGPIDEKRAAAFLDLPEDQRYPSRMS
ncbi:MAG: aldo/keto reductase [Akkermansiaceae bacterium]|jgi:predicted aldo/keto reductase-like oxidoreductase|nr:aldo/keto reductase [Akkermansiaceae bacterium]